MTRTIAATLVLMSVTVSSVAAQEIILRLDEEMLKPPTGVSKALDFLGLSDAIIQFSGIDECEDVKKPESIHPPSSIAAQKSAHAMLILTQSS